jgi:hypothetical protein
LGDVEEKKEDGEEQRFDYIFSNAPKNEHNLAKKEAAMKGGNMVINGDYSVDVQIASTSMIDSSSRESAKKILHKVSSKVLGFGGDACVNPNPKAAYGATLACEFAAMLVHLGVTYGQCLRMNHQGYEYIANIIKLGTSAQEFTLKHPEDPNLWVMMLLMHIFVKLLGIGHTCTPNGTVKKPFLRR